MRVMPESNRVLTHSVAWWVKEDKAPSAEKGGSTSKGVLKELYISTIPRIIGPPVHKYLGGL